MPNNLIRIDQPHQQVTCTFHVEIPDYGVARVAVIEFLASAPPELALDFRVRAIVVAEHESDDPRAVSFSLN